MKRSRWIAPVLAVTAVMASFPQAAAMGNPPPPVGCSVSDPSVISQYKSAQPVDANVVASGGITCPTPQNEAPGNFGPLRSRVVPARPTPGTPCSLTFWLPVQFRLAGAVPQTSVWAPPQIPQGTQAMVNPTN